MTTDRKRPRGYIGRQHETLGSDILAVLFADARWFGDMPASGAT
jgi:hypothetical protein